MLSLVRQIDVPSKRETIGVDEICTPGFLPEVKCSGKRNSELVESTLDLASQAGEITVRPLGNRYEVLHGFDYYFVYKELFPRGRIMVSVYNYTDSDAVNVSFSLNSIEHKWTPIDFSQAYKLAQQHFNWDITTLAKALGKARTTVSNMLRMNDLDPVVSGMIKSGKLRSEHGKHLCRLDKKKQVVLAKKCASKKWNTRELYTEIKNSSKPRSESTFDTLDECVETSCEVAKKDSNIAYVENTMSDVLGCGVHLNLSPETNYSGTMEFDIYSLCELQGIAEKVLSNNAGSIDVAGTIKLKVKNSEHLSNILSAFVNPEEF